MVILMSGLQSIPPDYIEAARIDGASAFQRFLLRHAAAGAPAFTLYA